MTGGENVTPSVQPDDGKTAESLTFSPMVVTDLHEVYYIEQSVFSAHWNYPNFQSSVAQKDDGWVMRNDQGKLIGYFILMEIVDEMHLLKIAVDENFHGQGFGRLLMDKAVEVAREAKMESVLLEVRPSNEPAVGLYKKTGFETIGVRKGYYVDTKEDALVMRLML